MAEYNGWTNYETWAVKLWMDNDEGSYGYWAERAAHWADQPSTSPYWSRADSAKFNLADELKDWHEDGSSEALPEASVWADLLGAALCEVNWHEIAEALLSEHVEAVL